MNRIAGQLLALLLTATLVPLKATGQARVPPRAVKPAGDGPAPGDPDQSRAREVARLEAWLARLPGVYEVTGSVRFPAGGYDQVKVTGRGECAQVGKCVGVHCVMSFSWPTVTPNGYVVQESRYTPAVVLYGFDPDAPGLHYLQVDNRSISEAGIGTLDPDSDNVANFEAPCVNRQQNVPATCVRRLQVTFRSRGVIRMNYITLMRPRDPVPYADAELKLTPRDQ